ncbi:ATP-binding protein [Streptomyces wuyuanensis]|uniref:ATP-binding protein n=1 Tax=Streptomyces wuyuanensis TaxID=1196353 RepID=UPI0037FCBBAE
MGRPQDLTERAELAVAELSTNAVLHGRLPSRSFRLTLAFESRPVSSASTSPTRAGTGRPQARTVSAVSDDSLPTGGPGLALVAAVADHCETLPFPLSDKTVRAVLSAP